MHRIYLPSEPVLSTGMKSLLNAMVASKLTLSLRDLKISLEEINEFKLSLSVSVSQWIDAIFSKISTVLNNSEAWENGTNWK